MPNAFATGKGKRTTVAAVTTGLLVVILALRLTSLISKLNFLIIGFNLLRQVARLSIYTAEISSISLVRKQADMVNNTDNLLNIMVIQLFR